MELTITISGSREEVGAAFRGLGEGLLQRVSETPRSSLDEQSTWTGEKVRALWKEINNNARRALKAISEQPDGIHRQELMAAVGAPTGYHLAGNLASIGFACNRLKMDSRPYEVDGWTYRMDPEVARTIASLTKEA